MRIHSNCHIYDNNSLSFELFKYYYRKPVWLHLQYTITYKNPAAAWLHLIITISYTLHAIAKSQQLYTTFYISQQKIIILLCICDSYVINFVTALLYIHNSKCSYIILCVPTACYVTTITGIQQSQALSTALLHKNVPSDNFNYNKISFLRNKFVVDNYALWHTSAPNLNIAILSVVEHNKSYLSYLYLTMLDSTMSSYCTKGPC